tara:strand:+ start:860 stop:1651 length:792 start_codon:yes stop_codon:yes gene_type:complete
MINEITTIIENGLKTLNKEQIAKINSRLPEYHRASEIIGHSTSQTSYSLQTMTMISDSPLSRMKQCISQINKKYQALQEAYYRIENKKLDILELSKINDDKSRLKIREEESIINTISVSMENSLRQIGMFQDMYDSIRVNNNVPENWSEKDYEKQEISHMVKASFRLAIQDITSTGRISHAAVEYWEQLGIHPQYAETITKGYLINIDKLISEGNKISITMMYDFLDEMVEEFKDSHKEALKRIGLDEIGSEGFMAEGATKPQ